MQARGTLADAVGGALDAYREAPDLAGIPPSSQAAYLRCRGQRLESLKAAMTGAEALEKAAEAAKPLVAKVVDAKKMVIVPNMEADPL